MSKFGFKQKDNTPIPPATGTIYSTRTTKMPITIDGASVLNKTTTIGIDGDIYANFVHENDHHVRIDNLPEDIKKRVKYLKKMLAVFPNTVTIEIFTVTR